MTGEVFKMYTTTLNLEMAKAGKHILLLMDNAASHMLPVDKRARGLEGGKVVRYHSALLGLDDITCGNDILVMSIVTRCNASFPVALSDGRIDHSKLLVKHGRVQE